MSETVGPTVTTDVTWKNWPWKDCRPLVIGGCARSGTTLLLSILSAHPEIAAVPIETRTLCPTAYDARPRRNAPFEFAKLAGHLDALMTEKCRVWCEKTPRNVLFFSRLLRTLGTEARMIHLVRDGRDVVCSKHPDKPDEFWVSPQRWITDVNAGLRLEGHRQVLAVRYEDLVLQTQRTLNEICRFVGLAFVPELMEYPDHAKLRRCNAWSKPAQPIFGSSIGRWRRAEFAERVGHLMAHRKASRLLEHYRYVLDKTC